MMFPCWETCASHAGEPAAQRSGAVVRPASNNMPLSCSEEYFTREMKVLSAKSDSHTSD